MLIQVRAIEIILQITRESHENHMFLSHHNNDLDYINRVIFKLKAVWDCIMHSSQHDYRLCYKLLHNGNVGSILVTFSCWHFYETHTIRSNTVPKREENLSIIMSTFQDNVCMLLLDYRLQSKQTGLNMFLNTLFIEVFMLS